MFAVDSLIAEGLKIVNKFVPDPEARRKAEQELREGLLEWDKAQLEVNKQEASHLSLFVAGWRPFIGWTCGLAFAWHFIGMPILQVVMVYGGFEAILPSFDMSALLTVLMGMLGLGGLRTYEKLKGVNKNH